MSYFFHSERAAAFAQRRSYSWRAFRNGVAAWLRAGVARRQQRQELLDYMVSDHRAAADLGITSYEARDWSKRLFWRN